MNLSEANHECSVNAETLSRRRQQSVQSTLKLALLFVRRAATPQPSGLERRAAGDSLFHASIAVAILVAVILWIKPLAYSDSLTEGLRIDRWWRDGVLMQISGYTLFGLSAIGLSLSARKRWRRLSRYSFRTWRLAHAVIGALSLVVLIAHTGLHLGVGLNLLLMLDYLGLACAGAVLGYLTAVGNTSASPALQRWKQRAVSGTCGSFGSIRS